MSELSVYEFEDIAWDELCMTNDHTVPGYELEKVHSLWRDNYNKPCNGVVGVQGNVRHKSSKRNGCQAKEPEELALIYNRRKRVLEHKEDDSDKEDSLAPVANRRFSHNFKSNNKDINMDSSGSEYHAVGIDRNSYSFPLSQTEKAVNFFDETHDIKDSRDFLYYGWPDIGNLEDVERMFSNEDEFKWFASSEDVEASIDRSNPEFEFPCSDSSLVGNKSKNCCEHSINETHLSVSDTCMKAAPSSWVQEKDKHESLGHFSSVNGICGSDTGADFMLIEQDRKFFPEVQNETWDTVHSTNGGYEMPTHGDQSQGEQKDQYLVNGGYSTSLLGKVSQKVSKGVSPELFSCMDIKQHHQPLVHESFGLLPCSIQYMHSDYSCPSDQTSEYDITYQSTPIIPSEKFENLHHKEALLQSSFSGEHENIDTVIQVPFCNPVSTQKKAQHQLNKFDILGDADKVRSELDSIYPSNQTSEYDITYQTTPIIPSEKFENLHHKEALLQSSFSGKHENIDTVIQVPFCNSVSTQKKAQHQQNKFGILGDADKVRSELDSTTPHESSSIGSASNEISLEAASFCQLQLVMEQLDARTKLCIRDSLYRLAQSAAQRHVGEVHDQDTCRIETANNCFCRCTEFLEMEANTNPIDRSIAHLLFHRPSALPKAAATTTTTTPTQKSSFHHNNTATAVSY